MDTIEIIGGLENTDQDIVVDVENISENNFLTVRGHFYFLFPQKLNWITNVVLAYNVTRLKTVALNTVSIWC